MRNWNSHQPWSTAFWWMFEAYLWGIETVPAASCSSSHMLVWSLPMRNWNCTWTIAWYRPGPAFEAYLWGIETCPYISPDAIITEFEAYLWGIETSFKHRILSAPWGFEAYLWGIETVFSDDFNRINIGLKPTYEELKPAIYNAGWDALPGLKPTYEELKQWSI